jgi:cell fate regulator YaaT (PSP1 superfamily)
VAGIVPQRRGRNDPYAEARERFKQRVKLSGIATMFRSTVMEIGCGCDGCECALPSVEGAALDLPEQAVAGVRFRDSGRTYYVDPGEWELEPRTWVVVETSRGMELAQVVIAPQQVIASLLDGELRTVVRVATAQDLEDAAARRSEEGDALRTFATMARDHKLPMKPISAEYAFDGSRLTFNFSSGGRVDFRELVRSLAHVFGCRIELHQVGPRDEARLLGGLGRCGRPLCCSTWLPQFADVSMTMARTQDLSNNRDKLSGVCGRLLCCLSYENDQYAEARSQLPRLGQEVTTEQGPGYVHALQILKETVTIRLDSGEDVTMTPGEFTVQRGPGRDMRSRRRPRRDTESTT